MRTIFFISLSVIMCMSSSAQPAEIGGVRAKIIQQQRQPGYEKDTSYINKVARLAYLYYALDADSMFFYADMALALSTKAGYQQGMAESLRQIGNAYMLTGDYTLTLSYYQQSLAAAERIHDKQLICLANSNIGLNYLNIGRYDDALEYTTRAYKLALELGNKLRLAGEYDNLAEIYFAKKEYDKAFEYARRALQMAAELKNDYYVAFLSNSLGNMLLKTGNIKQAMAYFTGALDFYVKTNDQLGITNTYLFIAKGYLAYKNYPVAVRYAAMSLEIAKAKKGKKDIADAAQTLADIYEQSGDYKSALQYLKTAKSYNDSLFNDESQKKLFELQAKFKYEQEEAGLKADQAKKDLESDVTMQSQKLQIVIAALIIFTLGVIVITLYQSRAEKLKINRVLQEKNTEIGRQKEELEKNAAELRVSNSQKDKLFSVIAHDLRSPFVSLQSLLTLFRDDAMSIDQVKEVIVKLNVNVDQTVSLVTNLLNWASSQMNGVTTNPVSFSLNNCAVEALTTVQKNAADKGITLHDEIPPETYVFADQDMIQLVVRNLLSNAVKFCKNGNSITVSAERKEAFIEVCVADTGAGITDDVLQKINNGESVTTYGTSREKGTGLGLLLCKDFIARNNGSFRVESAPGKGSRFYFTLTKAD